MLQFTRRPGMELRTRVATGWNVSETGATTDRTLVGPLVHRPEPDLGARLPGMHWTERMSAAPGPSAPGVVDVRRAFRYVISSDHHSYDP